MYLICEVYIFEKLLFFPHYESYIKKKKEKKTRNMYRMLCFLPMIFKKNSIIITYTLYQDKISSKNV